MKASIIISGQISGNFTLKAHLQTLDAVRVVNLPFSSFRIEFNRVSEAKEALRLAYKDLKSECSNVSFSTCYLEFDASTAKLVKGV